MLSTDELTDAQWQIADAIARQLVIEGTDVNELRKAATYLRDQQDEAGAGKKFFDYLKTLVRHGNAIGHSKRTLGYYQSLDAVCSQYLSSYQEDAPRMLYILSWAARLVLYYDKGVPTGEIAQPTVQSEREAEIQAVTQANKFEVGQELEATVTTIKGNKVTYEILGSIKLTQKEPKLASKLRLGQNINVRIENLRNGNSIKKIKTIY
ncbi:hypothetical protein PN498_12345 [Oscillatoria sp. CS-180]|uniref:hypothetical protein n=1 Tax=Oscillatoria sp. CS-180 TaxID=3021720 RepID=UPI00232D4078|nr:hypothetical protein [Oscillatoria sp. CS-180]MDB9526781.1 hypothetical protein [Oscillatoria sp. CS-180]